MYGHDEIISDLQRLGVRPGDLLMLHVSLRAVGAVSGGPAGLLLAVERAVGDDGTLMMVLGAGGTAEWSTEPSLEELRALRKEQIFQAWRSPAEPEVGWMAEVFRTAPGTVVSDHPLGRFAARGRLAVDLMKDAPWDDYYGPGSALDRFARSGGRVLRLGADLNTVTLLHLAEYHASIANSRRLSRYVAVSGRSGCEIRRVDSLDDAEGIVEWKGEDYFALVLDAYLASGKGSRGRVGSARSELLEGRELLAFGSEWMIENLGRRV